MNVFKTIKNIISNALNKLVDCIVPTLPIMIGVGMLKVLLILLGPDVLKILSVEQGTYRVLSFVADAGYYFMPIYVAVAAADVFKTNRFLAALCAGTLLSPTFIELVDQGVPLSVFSLPVASTKYGNQVIASVIIIWIFSYIYRFLDEKLHDNVKAILLPLLSILIITPISLCLVGPLGVFLSKKLVDLIMILKNIGPLGNALMCAIIPYITIAGLGGANLSAMLTLAANGVDPILFFSNVLYNNILGFVTLALYLKDKKPDTLAAAITSAVGGTSEPALFGIVMKDIKALLALTIGGFVGGLYAGITGVKSYAMASFGIFGIITTIGPDSSILHATIALILSCITGFIIYYITHKKYEQE